jgi:hypothetical protein
MARHSAINVVAEAVVATLNVAALRTLCPGGVYRNRPTAQTPPYVSVGPCSEQPDDAYGTHYGAVVTVPVRVVVSGADANGESRAVTILDKVMSLLDEPAVRSAATGWSVLLVNWTESRIDTAELDPLGASVEVGYVGTATFQFIVRPT